MKALACLNHSPECEVIVHKTAADLNYKFIAVLVPSIASSSDLMIPGPHESEFSSC